METIMYFPPRAAVQSLHPSFIHSCVQCLQRAFHGADTRDTSVSKTKLSPSRADLAQVSAACLTAAATGPSGNPDVVLHDQLTAPSDTVTSLQRVHFVPISWARLHGLLRFLSKNPPRLCLMRRTLRAAPSKKRTATHNTLSVTNV